MAVQVYPHGVPQTPANLIASSVTDVSSGSSACSGATGFPRSCSAAIALPPTIGVNDDVVVSGYDTAPSGGVIPSTAHVLGIGSLSNQAIVAGRSNTLQVYLDGVIAGLSGQAGFVSIPADGSAHAVSLVIDPSDYGDNQIQTGNTSTFANPIVVSLSESGGSGHTALSLDGGAASDRVTLTKSSDTVAVDYDGGGAAGYGATVTIAAAAVSGAGGASESVTVAPLFVSATTYAVTTKTLSLSSQFATVVTLTELNANGAASAYAVTPSGCTAIASAGSISGTRANARVTVTGGTEASQSGCTLTFSDGGSAIDVDVVNAASSASGSPTVTFTSWQTPTNESGARGITSGPDGALWFTEQQAGIVGRIPTDAATPNPTSTATANPDITEIPIGAGAGPQSIAAGPDGALWFTEQDAKKIARIPTDATQANPQVTVFPIPTSSPGITPVSITTGPGGNLWFGDCNTSSGHEVIEMTTAGTLVNLYPASGLGIASLATGPDGALWFTESSGKIGRIDANGNLTEASLPSGDRPGAIAPGPDGNMWFTVESYPFGIGQVSVTGGGIGAIAIFPTSDGIPTSIAAGPDGAMWFIDCSADKIGRISTTAPNTITEYSLPHGAFPEQIAQGPDGNLWYTAADPSTVGRVDIAPSSSARHARRSLGSKRGAR